MRYSRTRCWGAGAATLFVGVLGWLALGQGQNTAPVDWHSQPVPEAWKQPPSGKLAAVDGFSWFRCNITIPKNWRGSAITLYVEPVDNAREIYLNGVKIGTQGSFPPDYRSGLGETSQWQIPPEILRFDAENLLAIRVCDRDGRTGFNVAAPVLFGGKEAIRCQGIWQYRPGDRVDWAKEERTVGSAPKTALFSSRMDAAQAEKEFKKLQGEEGPLSPAASRQRLKIPGELALNLAVAEPHVRQPLSMKWDERGRLWVLQYLQYPNPAGLKMVSRDKFLRSVYDRVPPPPPHHIRGADKITIHADTNGDGVYDRHSTFVDGLSIATSFEWGTGGVWVLNPPYLLFYPDKDGDDRPDGPPEVHLEGFGLEDSHSVANNLRWGPDGWLYAAQGSTVTGNIKRPGLDKHPMHSMGQVIWRYHPSTRRYEIFAEGGGNSFGVEFDALGNLFSGHNGGDTRGFHFVQGGYYQKGFGKHGELSNPYSFGYFLAMRHKPVPRFTHAFLIYDGSALPPAYRGGLFGVAPLQGQVVHSQLLSDQATFRTEDMGLPITSTDPWFRPVDIQQGPDGAIYIADFYEQRIDHASHYQGRIHRESGRIYRLTARDAIKPEVVQGDKASVRELLSWLRHPNKWHRQTARRLLISRDIETSSTLEPLLKDANGQTALEALWVIHAKGRFNDSLAVETLRHPHAHVRAWTVRLLGDANEVSPTIARHLVELARGEPSIVVRGQLASTARRLPTASAFPLLAALWTRAEDAKDNRQPLLLWWALESKTDSDRDAVLELLADPKVWDYPLVRDHSCERLMRRYAQAGTRRDLLTCARLLKLAPHTEHAQRLMSGFEQAFQGRALVGMPAELLTAMAKAGGGSLALRLRQGEAAAVDEALALIANNNTNSEKRLLYVQVLGEVQQPRCIPVLLKILEDARDDGLRGAVLTALQSYNDPRVGSALVRLHPKLSHDMRVVAQTVLSSRKPWTVELLEAIDKGQIERQEVSPPMVRRFLFHADPRIATWVRKFWGEQEGTTNEQMRQEVDRLAKIIANGSGNPYQGKKLFQENCGKCHVLFNQGGKIGPDLTAYKRDDVQTMLLHIVNPSAEIREGFENYLVVTADGRTLNGFIAERDNRVVVLRGTDGQTVSVPVEDIEDMRAIQRSLMPEGALKSSTPQQVRDLFAYLRATQPLP